MGSFFRQSYHGIRMVRSNKWEGVRPVFGGHSQAVRYRRPDYRYNSSEESKDGHWVAAQQVQGYFLAILTFHPSAS